MKPNLFKKPNLFNFATSELSQDAFLCWLISWASPECKDVNDKLHVVANEFIRMLANNKDTGDIDKICVWRQRHRIDVLVRIKNKAGAEFIVVIEDKVRGKDHSNQLERYKQKVKNIYKVYEGNILPVYLHTGVQSDYESARDAGYTVIKRDGFLAFLKQGYDTGIRDDIYVDFYRHLEQVDDDIKNYKEVPYGKWNGHNWIGFFYELEKKFPDAKWNGDQSGGVLRFYWGQPKFDAHDHFLYFSIQYGKLYFKMYVKEKSKSYKIRDAYRIQLESAINKGKAEGKSPPTIKFTSRRGGVWLTLAELHHFPVLDKEHKIDMPATLAFIESIQQLKDTVEQVNSVHYGD